MADELLTPVLQDVWNRLSRSAGDPGAPCGLATLGTVNEARQPCLRTVVLREVDLAMGEIRCYTDRRSHKVQQILDQPLTSWLFYDAVDRLQITLTTTATIITEGSQVEAAWERCRPESRRNFQSLLAPGTPLDAPPGKVNDAASFLQETHEFAIISARIFEIDWLQLRLAGNHRAHFSRVDNAWTGEWLAP